MKTRSPRLLAGLLLTAAALAPSASAAPVTVNLRVEGPTSTLYEGPVTTDARSYATPDNGRPVVASPYPCNVRDNGPTHGTGTASGTPTTALNDAASRLGIAVGMKWYGQSLHYPQPPAPAPPVYDDIYDFFVNSIGGVANESVSPYRYWTVAVDGAPTPSGGCQTAVAPAQEVIWAYVSYGDTFLRLDGSAIAQPGDYVQVRVRDTAGNPIAGAQVGGQTTNAQGLASIAVGGVGQYSYKATKTGSVRSNAFVVCVHNGNDGNCGTLPPAAAAPAPTTDPTTAAVVSPGSGQVTGTTAVAPSLVDKIAPEGVVSGIDEDEVFAAGKGPRELSGTAGEPASRRATLKADPSGLASVQIRLLRRTGKTCSAYDGKAERFKAIKCGRNATYFSVGTSARWRYLLPSRLGTGSYQLDVLATDKAGNADTKRRAGSNRISFRVK